MRWKRIQIVCARCLRAGGARFGRFRWRGANDVVDSGLCFARVPFRQMAVESEGDFSTGTNEKKKPGILASLEKNRGKVGGGRHDGGLQIGLHRQDLLATNDEFYGNGIKTRAKFRPVNDKLSARHPRYFVFGTSHNRSFTFGVRCQDRRKQNRCEKKSEAKDGSDPALRKREREEDEGGAEDSEGQTEYEPGMLIAARMQVIGKRRAQRVVIRLQSRRVCFVGGGRTGDLTHACLEARVGWARGIMLAGNGTSGAGK